MEQGGKSPSQCCNLKVNPGLSHRDNSQVSQRRANSPGQRPAPVFQEALPVIGHCTDVNELSFTLQCRKTLHFTSQRSAGLSKPLPAAELGYLQMRCTTSISRILCWSRNTWKSGELMLFIPKAGESCWVLRSSGRAGTSQGSRRNGEGTGSFVSSGLRHAEEPGTEGHQRDALGPREDLLKVRALWRMWEVRAALQRLPGTHGILSGTAHGSG